MKLKTGLIIGFGAGYVLGAKAGRERYDQIRRMASRVAETETAQQLVEKGTALVDLGAARARQVVSEGIDTAAGRIRERVGA